MNIELLGALTERIVSAGVDIAPSYNEYVQLAFAIATDCGEAGREYFYRICRCSAKWDARNAEKLFSGAITSAHGNVHLSTAVYLADRAGINVKNLSGYVAGNMVQKVQKVHEPSFAHSSAVNDGSGNLADRALNGYGGNGVSGVSQSEQQYSEESLDDSVVPSSEPSSPLPLFPHYEWPHLLSRIIGYAESDAQRDVMLLGALTTLGATMWKYVQVIYGRKRQNPCLQTFIVAPPASGKGVLSHIRRLAEPIHDELRRSSEKAMQEYRKKKKDAKNDESIEMPHERMFLISGNNSGTGIMQNVIDNNGRGLVFETEADTVSTSIGSDYGHWSDILRRAFDQDRLSYNRRTDHEYRETARSYLSVLLSGTPAQVQPLIPSAENGLFSRQIFYYMPAVTEWKDQLSDNETDLDDIFIRMGEEWAREVKWIELTGLFTLKFTQKQHRRINAVFSALLHRSEAVNGMEMNSSVERLAISAVRMISVVAMLRMIDKLPAVDGRDTWVPAEAGAVPSASEVSDNVKDRIVGKWNLSVSDADFEAVLSLVSPLYEHATHIVSFLPSSGVKRRTNSERNAIFSKMDKHFSHGELMDMASEMGISPNTANTWLKRMVKLGIIKHDTEYGMYVRIDN